MSRNNIFMCVFKHQKECIKVEIKVKILQRQVLLQNEKK